MSVSFRGRLFASALAVGCSGAALAQSFPDDGTETVYVVGQRAIVANSLARQKASDSIESVLNRDAIGQLPDQNVAEAARRMTGINVLNDQGEGRFIAVRGFGPDLNAASVNGTRLPAPEANVRGVALDVIPSELVESIEVVKTLTPDMDADTIGASIQINTTRGFDHKEPFLSINAEGGYNNKNGKLSPKAGIDFAYPVSDRLGIAGGFSYNRRSTATDNTEMSGWTVSGKAASAGVAYADTLEYRDYDVVRTRMGGSLSLDWKASENATLYLRGIYSVFEDQEMRRRLVFQLSAAPASGDADHARFLSGDGRIRVRRDLKDRFEGQTIQSYQAGGDTVLGPWTLQYQGSFSRSSEHEWRTQDPTRFQQDFKKSGQLAVTFDYSDLDTTLYDVTTGSAAFLNTSGYKLTQLSDKNGLATDKEAAYRLDVSRRFALPTGGELEIRAGGKVRLRNKAYTLTNDIYDGFSGTYTLADVAGKASYDLTDIGPVPDRAAVRAFNKSHSSGFVLNQLDSDNESASAYYGAGEDIYAGYLMGRYTSGPLMIVGGARVEHMQDKLRGNLAELVAEGGSHNGVVVGKDTLFVTPIAFKKTYTDVLPSLGARYEATDGVMLRGGAFESIVRPNFADMAPHFLVEENDVGERKGSFGNPALDPYRAWNIDLSGEWYFARDGVLQVGLFYKDISDFIVKGSFEASDAPYLGAFNGVRFDQATIPMNGDKATAKGLEFNYQQSLTMLPGALDGLLVGFNYTYTDATGDIVGRSIPLPASSKNTFNATLGYEKGDWSLRVSANYRSGYLDELGGSAGEDRYVKSHLQWDVSAKYALTKNLRLYANLQNLSDEPYLAYQHGPGRDRLLQYETYSWGANFGVKYNL